MMFDKKYLKRLQEAGRISRMLKKSFIYPKLCKYAKGNCLDFGCGDLSFSRYLKDTHPDFEIVGFDINSHIKPIAKNLGIEFHSKIDDLSGKFDFIICDNVLEHIKNWESCLLELFKRMKKNSSLVVGLPGIQGYCYDLTHKTFITTHDIQRFAQKMGLKYKKRVWYPLNLEIVANVAQLYSRHVLVYHILAKQT